MVKKEDIISKLDCLDLKRNSPHFLIARLIRNKFFDNPKKTQDVIEKIKGISGKRLKSNIIQTYMKKFLSEEIIACFSVKGEKGNYWYINSITEDKARNLTGLSKMEAKIADQLFSDKLLSKLNPSFESEIQDLNVVFGKSGTCTAFLLRKILEKLIFLAFAKHNIENKIE